MQIKSVKKNKKFIFIYFFIKKFGQFKKKYYLCSVKQIKK